MERPLTPGMNPLPTSARSLSAQLRAPLISAAQVARIDAASAASGVSVETLMENAGNAVATEIAKRWSPRNVTVLCGPGNNGGDGYVVARLLAERGWPVRVGSVCVTESVSSAGSAPSPAGSAPSLATQQRERCPVAVEVFSPDLLAEADLVVDAVFGVGISRQIAPEICSVFEAVNVHTAPVVAVDLPSGLDSNTARLWGPVPRATLTVTFVASKPALVLAAGRDCAGEVVVAEIGVPPAVLAAEPMDTWENTPGLWEAELPQPGQSDHKYSRGHAVVIGGPEMTGAARLAARSAARVGAGLVSVFCPPQAFTVYAAALESILVKSVDGASASRVALAESRASAVLIGPGLGRDDASEQHLNSVLEMADVARVFDADALTLLGRRNGLPTPLTGAVLTPHEGEFARVFDVEGDRLTRARAAASASGAVVVLKGPDTVVAHPDGRAAINRNAPPTLATAGSGDVLAGLVVGLLAQGMGNFDAACAAVWIHGAAAATFGPGLIAGDLPDLIPHVLRSRLGGR